MLGFFFRWINKIFRMCKKTCWTHEQLQKISQPSPNCMNSAFQLFHCFLHSGLPAYDSSVDFVMHLESLSIGGGKKCVKNYLCRSLTTP